MREDGITFKTLPKASHFKEHKARVKLTSTSHDIYHLDILRKNHPLELHTQEFTIANNSLANRQTMISTDRQGQHRIDKLHKCLDGG